MQERVDALLPRIDAVLAGETDVPTLLKYLDVCAKYGIGTQRENDVTIHNRRLRQ